MIRHSPKIRLRFPVGYHHLHDDVSLNFQMNRWFNWVGDGTMLSEMRSIARRVRTYADWRREFSPWPRRRSLRRRP